MDDATEPMAYASGKDIDPTDLILGTVKMSGQRQHGFGVDTMRAWAVSIDSDKNQQVKMEDIEKVNQNVK